MCRPTTSAALYPSRSSAPALHSRMTPSASVPISALTRTARRNASPKPSTDDGATAPDASAGRPARFTVDLPVGGSGSPRAGSHGPDDSSDRGACRRTARVGPRAPGRTLRWACGVLLPSPSRERLRRTTGALAAALCLCPSACPSVPLDAMARQRSSPDAGVTTRGSRRPSTLPREAGDQRVRRPGLRADGRTGTERAPGQRLRQRPTLGGFDNCRRIDQVVEGPTPDLAEWRLACRATDQWTRLGRHGGATCGRTRVRRCT